MIEILVDKITVIVAAIGYLGIIILMALESTMFPLPSELVMPFAGFLVAEGKMSFLLALIAGTIGCLIGSLISYYIGYKGGYPFVKKFGKYFLINENHLKKAENWFYEKGKITIFFGRFIPGVRHVISIPAGVGKMNLYSFSLFTVLGAGIWNFILLYLGYVLEKNWKLIYNYTTYIDIVIIIALFIAVIYYVNYIINSMKDKF